MDGQGEVKLFTSSAKTRKKTARLILGKPVKNGKVNGNSLRESGIKYKIVNIFN